MSVAMALASGNPERSAIAIAPEPVPRSQILTCGAKSLACGGEHDIDQRLGLGTRHQRRRAKPQSKALELGLAEDAGDGLAVFPPTEMVSVSRQRKLRNLHRVPCAIRAAASRPAASARRSRASSAGLSRAASLEHRAPLGKRLGIGHRSPSSNSESFFAWSSAISASTISSSASPSITLSSL